MKMYCTNCDHKKPLKQELVSYRGGVIGLDYVTLKGVRHYRCPECGEVYYNFGNLRELNSLLVGIVAHKKGDLEGQEIRFIRKFLGYSSQKFADLLRIEPETLSRYENDKKKMGPSLEQLVRVLALTSAPDRNYDDHDRMLAREHKFSRIVLSASKKYQWQASIA